MHAPTEANLPAFTELLDLAQARLGGQALACSDEFFAEKENLLKAGRAIFLPDEYTPNGKWMDGWESRRKRDAGHDWCFLKLGVPGVLHGVDVDTLHFTGNYPEHASLDAVCLPGDPSVDDLHAANWTRLVPISLLQGTSHNFFDITSKERWTHLRLNIYPDGGVARFRAYGIAQPFPEQMAKEGGLVDLASAVNGAMAVLANNQHFGHRSNLLMPGDAKNMGEGWETKRKRGPGNDWNVIRLAMPGRIQRVVVDTKFFKGNFPEACTLEGLYLTEKDAPPADFFANRNLPWVPILGRSLLQADHPHVYEDLLAQGPFTHVRLSIHPCGGVSRLRLWGQPEAQA